MSAGKPYKVFIDDNFHYGDESERYASGEYDTLEEALEKCREIVDDYLMSASSQGVTLDKLFESYIQFGEDPFIIGAPSGSIPFSGRDHARERCTQWCAAVGFQLPPSV